MVFDKYSGKASGYCFVDLSDGDAARRAMLNISGKVIPKSKPPTTFNLSFANSPSAPYTEYNLFVNDIPLELDDSGLFLIFGEKYRSCRGAKVYRNPDGSSRGLGFVRFADQTDQQRALVEMNKMNVRGKQMKLKLAQPKFRAPRGTAMNPRGTTTTILPAGASYDPLNYYPQHQEYYNSAAFLQPSAVVASPAHDPLRPQPPLSSPANLPQGPSDAKPSTAPMLLVRLFHLERALFPRLCVRAVFGMSTGCLMVKNSNI